MFIRNPEGLANLMRKGEEGEAETGGPIPLLGAANGLLKVRQFPLRRTPSEVWTASAV